MDRRPFVSVAAACSIAAAALAQVPSHLAPAQNVRSHAYDSARGRLYMATDNGLLRWDSEAQVPLSPWLQGRNLRGMDLTVDGASLLVCEGPPSSGRGQLHRIDLATGQVTTLTFALQAGESSCYDVIALANGRAFVTTAGASFGPLRELTLATNTFAVRTDFPGPGGQISELVQLNRSADGGLGLFVQSNNSSGPVTTYDAATDSFPATRNFNVFFFQSLAAVSRDGARIALEDAAGLRIVDRQLANLAFVNAAVYGAMFDPLRDRLYTPQAVGAVMEVRDTATFGIVSTFPIGEPVAVSVPQAAGEMSMASDGSYLCYRTPSGVRLYRVGLPRPIVDGVSPPAAHWSAGAVPVTVRGRFFDTAAGSAAQVRIGGLPASDVRVVDGQTLTCMAPGDMPGPKDVEVQFLGQPGQRSGAFARTPALTLGGNLAPGGTAMLRVQVRIGDWVGGYFSLPPAIPSTVPGVASVLWLEQATAWFTVPNWPLPEFLLSTAIPDDPNLLGLQLVFQSLTFGSANDAVLSNHVELRL